MATRCVDGRLYRHDPQPDDPDLETDIGQCPECAGKGCPHEFAFDIVLAASVRIRAPSEAEARAQLADVFDCADLSVCHAGVKMNDTFEASLAEARPLLFEVDGEAV